MGDNGLTGPAIINVWFTPNTKISIIRKISIGGVAI